MATTIDPRMDNFSTEDAGERAPLVLGGLDYNGVTESVASVWESDSPPKIWWIVLLGAASLLMILGACIAHLFLKGVGY